MNAPELRIDIPADHPWAKEIIARRYRTHWPYGSITFAGTECRVMLVAVVELSHEYDRTRAPHTIRTTWKACQV
jgi:hypothetical protein